MLVRVWIICMVSSLVSGTLTGNHICEVEERYPVNITHNKVKKVSVRNYKWCLRVPPRCSFYTEKIVRVPEIVERLQTQIVRKCCPGFVENDNRDGCVPCRKCFEGTCGKGGSCLCNSGFRGEDCADACEPMRWGMNCQQECQCEHGTCNPRTGKCDCPTGWFGTRCEVPCLEGFYGKHCVNRCSCGERDLCSPDTGECLKKPIRHQEHQSTRAIHYMTEDILNLTITMNKQRSTPSLKKYYTFDMELDSRNKTAAENEIVHEPNKSIANEKKISTIPQGGWSKINNTTEEKSKNVDESTESTTEMSAEVILNSENVAIIDENGSLENEQKASNENSLETFFESERNSPKININEQLDMQKNETLQSNNSVSLKSNGNELVNNRNEKQIQIEKSDNTTTINEDLEVTLSSKVIVTQTTPFLGNYNFSNDENRSSSFMENPKVEVTPQSTEDIIPPTMFKTNTITTHPSKTFEFSENMEENELQNLDLTNNFLTSGATTTSSPVSTSATDRLKKGILPVADVIPSTKSIDIRNDLITSESTENRISMKVAYGKEHDEEEFANSLNKNDITTPISVIAVVSCILVLILSGIIFVHHYIRKKKTKTGSMKIENKNCAGHTVSVYTHSIFHTPLPDPPVFENPVFKSPINATNEPGTFQTHVICNLNFPENRNTDKKEYTYDHPPSTGSYRAASIPEPPEIFEPPSSEPVYDEIPSNRRGNHPISPPPSYKSSCLYMNTCARTRL